MTGREHGIKSSYQLKDSLSTVPIADGYGVAQTVVVSVSYIGSGEPPQFISNSAADGFICSRLVEESLFNTMGPDWLNFMFSMVPNGSNTLDIPVYGLHGEYIQQRDIIY